MAQLVVAAAVSAGASAAATAAGYAAGATFLGMTAGGWGWLAGSMIGARLFGPSPQDGPRIEDKRVQSNTYGQPIPICYGTIRVAGQTLWASELIEASEEVGGKGGGGATMYSYSVNLLTSVCEGPVAAVLRIWANGRLIWRFNGADGEIDEELLQPGSVRVYLGTEDQLPDPTYEAAVGTENAVAYRGQVVVAIDGLQLDPFGNRPPSLEFEVAGEVEAAACPVDPIHATEVQQAGLYTQGYAFSNRTASAAYDAATSTYYIVTEGDDGSVRQIEAYDVSGEAPVLSRVIDLEEWGIATTNIFVAGMGFDPENGLLRVSAGYVGAGTGSGAPTEYIWDGEILHESAAKFSGLSWGDFPVSGQIASNGARHGIQYAIYPSSPAGGSVLRGEVGWWSYTSSIVGFRLARLVNGSQGGGANEYAWFQQSDASRYTRTSDVIYIPKRSGVWNGGGFNLAIRWEENAIYLDNEGAVSLLPWDGAGGYSLSMSRSLVYAPRRKKVYIVADGNGVGSINIDATQVYALTVDGPIQSWPTEITNDPTFSVWNEAGDCLVVGRTVGAGLVYWTIDPDTMTVLTGPCSYDEYRRVVAAKDLGDGRFACILEDTGEVGSGPDAVAIIDVPVGGATGQPITLQEIVEDLCERSGLPAGNLDASAGTDLVGGYKVARPTSARACIDQLRPGYFFDMVESGTKLVLRKRGAAAVATIDAGELGAAPFQLTRSEPEPAYQLEHIEETEAPRELSVQWIDASANYDPGYARASRQAAGSQAITELEIPVVFDGGPDEAQAAAWVNLLHAHASKNPIKLALSHAYDHLEPADAIIVPLASGSQRVWISEITRARPMVEIEGQLEDGEIYDRLFNGVPRESGPLQTNVAQIAGTVLALLDLPPLRDQDDALLRYVALGPSEKGKAWGGAALYKSVDGGTSFGSVLTTTSPVTLGATVGKLGDWTGGNVWDDENTVDVALSSGTFSSATDLAVLNGANAIAVAAGDDWEIVQFTTAELVGTDTWRLSRLLRGRRGTERCIDGHATGDRVVLLSTASLRVAYEQYAEIGVERHYKAVTSGGAVSDAASVPRTLAANSLKPLSPVHISGARDESNNLTISWVRRARIAAEWIDARDVALDEPTEAYEIDIYDGTSIVRTIEASTPTASYSAAEQTADGLTPGDPVVCAIYQISSRVGRGHAGEATV